jgi:hypothetical protein
MPMIDILIMGLGIFLGNLLIYGIGQKDWEKGFFIGIVSFVVYVPLDLIFMR